MRKHICYNTVNFQPVTVRILFFRGIQTLQMRLSWKACFLWTQLLRPFCRAADELIHWVYKQIVGHLIATPFMLQNSYSLYIYFIIIIIPITWASMSGTGKKYITSIMIKMITSNYTFNTNVINFIAHLVLW